MTIENEKMDGQLYKMQKERKKIRKDLKIAWDTFAKKSDSKVQSTLFFTYFLDVFELMLRIKLLTNTTKRFRINTRKLNLISRISSNSRYGIQAFVNWRRCTHLCPMPSIDMQELTNQGTEALVGRVKAEQEKKQALLLENERLMKDIKERIPAEDQEVSQDILRKVIDILETTQLVRFFLVHDKSSPKILKCMSVAFQRIASFVDDKTAEAFRKNQRIKNELVIHHNQQSRSLERIFELEAINSKIRLEHMKWDKEHDIKNFRSKMTCTPDMEFYFQS